MVKVAVIFALSGACTCNEIHGMMSNDVKLDGPSIAFKIENPEYGIKKKFVITAEPYFNIVKTTWVRGLWIWEKANFFLSIEMKNAPKNLSES